MTYYDKFKYELICESSDAKQKQSYWNTAFGLQAVDGLKPSEYMISLAKENVKGNFSYSDVDEQITAYYKDNIVSRDEQEADLVSLHITQILDNSAFSFVHLTLKQYHKLLFSGVNLGINDKYIGEFRDYNISKKEAILNNNSVIYADYRMIEDTLQYDFDEERRQKYIQMTVDEQIYRIAEFTSRIWQVHPFGEGNTRTTAVFMQKYLNSKGFTVNNDLFKDNALYFRNALVRANYTSMNNGIEATNSFLVRFFENLIADKDNSLTNNDMNIFSSKAKAPEQVVIQTKRNRGR